MFEGGITDLYYVLKYCKESFQNTSIIVDSEQAMMVAHHSKPVFTKVSWWNTDLVLIICTEFD
jgi:LIM domain-binding protein 2